jgi:hypothetical protein
MYGMIGGLLLACVLLLAMPKPGFTAEPFSQEVYSDIADALRDADLARDRYHEHRGDQDAGRYEQEWLDHEHKLEEARINRMAHEAKLSPHEIRKMRGEGHDWKMIFDRHKVDSRKMGYGLKGPHDYDRDHDRDMHRHIYKKNHPAKGHKSGQSS